MRLEAQGDETRLTLTTRERHLLLRALERATFTDTPIEEQAAIAAFCARVLEALRAQGA